MEKQMVLIPREELEELENKVKEQPYILIDFHVFGNHDSAFLIHEKIFNSVPTWLEESILNLLDKFKS
jgi:hypothetical protein